MQRRQLILGSLAAALPRAYAITDDTQWTDTARRRELPLRLRWPKGDAPCALVLHSHGLGGNREGGDAWGRAWQAAGMAVLHLQHPGSDSEVLRQGGIGALRAAASAQQLRERVADVQFVIGQALRRAAAGEGAWARVRRDAIGVSGHSFGAHTVQALAGQRFAVAAEGAADPRIRAFIAFSPSLGASGLSPSEQFSGVMRPFLAATGSHDNDPLGSAKGSAEQVPADARAAVWDELQGANRSHSLGYGEDSQRCRSPKARMRAPRGTCSALPKTGADRARVYDGLPRGQRALLWIDGADHATFGGNTATRRRAARLMRRHPDAERDEAQHQARIARASTDWWRAMLLGDDAALRALSGQVRMD